MKKNPEDMTPQLKKFIEESMGKKFKKITICSSNKVSEYSNEVSIVLKAIGVEAFVSDESTISDFIPAFEFNVNELSKTLGVPVSEKDYIWEVACRIRNRVDEN